MLAGFGNRWYGKLSSGCLIFPLSGPCPLHFYCSCDFFSVSTSSLVLSSRSAIFHSLAVCHWECPNPRYVNWHSVAHILIKPGMTFLSVGIHKEYSLAFLLFILFLQPQVLEILQKAEIENLSFYPSMETALQMSSGMYVHY